MTTTTRIQLDTPAHGANVDSWDAPINGDFVIIDACFGAVTSKALTNVNISLSVTEAQAAIIRLSGTLTGNVQITLPAIYKGWIVQNNTTGNFVVTVSGGVGNVVGLPPGASEVFWDSANVQFKSLPHFISEECRYGGTAVPAWITACTVPPYLLADGSSFSAGTYPALAAIYGGTTLPDSRGRARYNLNGGTGRITSVSSYGIDGNTLFAAGGQQTLDQVQLPNATFAVSDSRTWALKNDVLIPGGSSGSGNTGGNGQVPSPTLYSQVSPAGLGVLVSGSAPTAASGGLGRNLLPPGYVGGITMIRAA